MRKTISQFFVVAIVFLFCFQVQALNLSPLENKEAYSFIPPEVIEKKLPQGTKLYFIKNNNLSIFEMSILFPMGIKDDPQDQRGLFQLFMQMIATGGSQTRSPDQVDQILESVAASISYNVDKEYSEIKIKSLQSDMDLVLDVLFDLLKSPGFDEDRFELTKKKYLASIKKRNESPMHIARREFKQKLYGDKSVWARNFRKSDIENIKLKDLRNLHKKVVQSKWMSIVISAKSNLTEIERKLAGRLDQISSSEKKLSSSIPEVQFDLKKQINLIHHTGNQSSVVIGHLGGKRFQKDKFATILANFVLGGSTFGSRLGARIRTTLGLAYSIYSQYSFGTDYGIFAVMASTKTESTEKLISEVSHIIEEMQTVKPITEKELEFAKQTLLNQMIFQYDSGFKIASQERFYDFYGYPDKYLEVYQRELKSVTVEEVNQAIKKNFHPKKLQVMVVGDTSQLNLSQLGEVKVLPLDQD